MLLSANLFSLQSFTVKNISLQDISFYLGQCKVEPTNNKLSYPDSGFVSIRPKVMSVLVCLSENANQMVSRSELINKIWQGNEPVGSRGVTDAIWRLRKHFCEYYSQPLVIETIARKGYILNLEPRLVLQQKKHFLYLDLFIIPTFK